MDRKISLAVTSVAAVLLVATTVTASPSRTNTPLFTFRMEQSSSKMSFLPTELNTFAYTTENGYRLNYDILECCGADPLIMTFQYTCEFYNTCDTCMSTCLFTCNPTCTSPHTCKYGGTCSTCTSTCSTCNPTCTDLWTCYQTGC